MTLYSDSDEPSEGQYGNVLTAFVREQHSTVGNTTSFTRLRVAQAVNEEAMVNPTFETHVRIELTLSSDTLHMIRDSECDKDKQKQRSRRRSNKKSPASGIVGEDVLICCENRTVSYRRC